MSDTLLNYVLHDKLYDPSISFGHDLKLHHLVVTRFAFIRSDFEKRRNEVYDQEFGDWAKSRSKLFRDICLPSMLGQSQKPDAWLLGLARERRQYFPELKALFDGNGWIAPAWQEMVGDVPEQELNALKRAVLDNVPNEADYVITTRLDNDDALHRSFLAVVKDYVSLILSSEQGLTDFWLTMPYGLQLGSDKLGVCCYTNNPFTTRVQTRENFLSSAYSTALAGDHTKLFKNDRVFSVNTRIPMWLQGVHGDNLYNRMLLTAIAVEDHKRLLSGFSVKVDW
ncbi:glycosyltransferase [Methylorubrum populi]|nr:glycosyltransferase [Methylorubrum populi]